MGRISVRFAGEHAAAAEAQRQADSRGTVVWLVQTTDDEGVMWEVHDSEPAQGEAIPVRPR